MKAPGYPGFASECNTVLHRVLLFLDEADVPFHSYCDGVMPVQ